MTGPAGFAVLASAVAALSPATGPAVWVAVVASVVALGPAGARWLRVAQREHYLADASSRFAVRWWRSTPVNAVLAAVALAGLVASDRWPLAALAPAGVMAVGPLGLSVRGRTSPLVATRRLRTLAAVWLVLQAVVVVIGVVVGAAAPFAAAGAVVVPALVDLACLLTGPYERWLVGRRYVRPAAERLRRVGPTVVGITGSYGKTSTKSYVAHLVAGSRTVVASPASFNNRAGLARAVNEHLVEGTEVFVAEMGTYGRGEIRELCRWCPPAIAVMTAVGPVHLERFGTEDAIAAAKAEIAERAPVVVVNADDRRLAELAGRWGSSPVGPEVVRCSAVDPSADVCVLAKDGTVLVAGARVVEVPLRPGVQATNLACALAVAIRLGVPAEVAAGRVATLPQVPNRLAADRAPSGLYVVDDTFNSNPAGARAALEVLASAPVGGRRVLVTPGMVELGPRQASENEAFAAAARQVVDDLVVVGRTNRRALVRGAAPLHPVVVRTRHEAVAWVRANLGPGDAVLYENDLPDHYP
ncbi:MAG: Mur ligase family protein [Acidimicrobiales bacterium]